MEKSGIQNFIGNENLSIVEAMRLIDENQFGTLFLINDLGKLVGCITDGDIRRFLLRGGNLNDCALSAANKLPKYATKLEEAKNLYDKKDYILIPIVDSDFNIVDIYSGEEGDLPKKIHNSLKIPVIINAGGKGTRLEPYTKVLPKPLIPVGELPIIEHIINEYQSYDCDEFHIIVNYKKDLIKAYFSDNDNRYKIYWYEEKEPLGTGGGLSLLRNQIDSVFFFSNCDILLTANYESMLKFHKENKNVITMICAYKTITIPYGVVDIGVNGSIESMKEKPVISCLTNTGMYIVEPEVIDDIEDGKPIDFPDVIEMERKNGKKVAVFPVSENDWMDMGQFPELEKMSLKISK